MGRAAAMIGTGRCGLYVWLDLVDINLLLTSWFMWVSRQKPEPSDWE